LRFALPGKRLALPSFIPAIAKSRSAFLVRRPEMQKIDAQSKKADLLFSFTDRKLRSATRFSPQATRFVLIRPEIVKSKPAEQKSDPLFSFADPKFSSASRFL